MAIQELLKTGGNFQLVVSAADLKEFALSIVEECRKSAETAKEPEKYLNRFEAARMLGISTNALWRWQREGYLVPNKVGHRNIYPLSKLQSLMAGEANNLDRKEG